MAEEEQVRRDKIQRLKDELFGDMLTTAEVAEILDIHPRTVGDYIREGRLRGIQIGGGWRVPEVSLREFVAELTLASPAPRKGRKSSSGMFSRFVDQSRETVRLAADEARALQHNYIGTEHLLLALLAQRTTTATVFHEAAVTHQAAREEIVSMVGLGSSEIEGTLPFTPRAKRILELSLRSALRHGGSEIHPEHIGLALIEEGEGVASQVVRKLADADSVRARLIALAAA